MFVGCRIGGTVEEWKGIALALKGHQFFMQVVVLGFQLGTVLY